MDEIEESRNFGEKTRFNYWMISTFVLGLIIILLLFTNISGRVTGNVISGTTAGENLVAFLNTNAPSEVTLNGVESESGLYKVNVDYLGQTIPVYITKDGKYFVQGVIPLTPTALDSGSGSVSDSDSELIEVSIDDDAVKGQNNAPVTIIEFSDYQCPYCGKYYSETYKQIEKDYINTGKVKYVLRDFPLNFHENAQKAAEATECVRNVAGNDVAFWKMHDKLFENQDKLDVSSLKSYAKDLSYNIDSCLDSGKFASEVKKDLSDGQSYGVSGTPAFFINGRLVEGAQPYANFKQIIDAELAKVA